MAHACEHKNKPHYSNGLCQNCYLAQYYLKRKKKLEDKKEAEKLRASQKEDKTVTKSENNDSKDSEDDNKE